MTSNIVKNSETVYFTFGRFQPPTIGHRILIDFVAKSAEKIGADALVFVSSTINKLGKAPPDGELAVKTGFKNPLDVAYKISTLTKMFPEEKVQYVNTEIHICNNPFKAIEFLLALGYKQLYFIVGSDRYPEFNESVNKYVKKFKITTPVTVVSAGQRINNKNSESATTMSGTRMRNAATKKNFASFKKGVATPSFANNNVMNLMHKVRSGLGLRGGRTRRHR